VIQCAEGALRLFYILYGKNDFHRDKELQKIKAGLGSPETLAHNTTLLDGKELSLTQLKDACSAFPSLLSPYRLVIVEHLLERFERKPGVGRPKKDPRKKRDSALPEWQGLGDYIKQMPPTTELVLIDGDVNNKNKNPLLKSLSPVAKVMPFRQLWDKDIANWIEERVRKCDGTITPAAIKLLAELIGGDLYAMGNEIDKLLNYSSAAEITEDNVRRLTSQTREPIVFDLVDAVVEGRRKDAQLLLHRLLQDGAAPIYLLVMITQQFRNIVRAKELSGTLQPSQILDRLGLAPKYPLAKLLKQARAYDLERIKRAYHEILEADIALKTGEYDNDQLPLDLLVTELCRS
jgi:DNA polymerase-3 subunit delta